MYKLLMVILFFWCFNVSANEDNLDYKLGAGDQVSIKVFRSPDLQTEARISGNGMINFPLLGQIKLSGMTPFEVENEISRQLIEKNLMVAPSVTVFVTDFSSKTYTILGHVAKPGFYPITRNLKLTDVIAIAGGTTEFASDIVNITSTFNGEEVKNKYDIKQLLNNESQASNPEIKNNDIISIPKYPVFFIYGQVNKPGEYKLDSGMRLSQALSISGGVTLIGSIQKMEVESVNAAGKLERKQVDLTYSLNNKDVIYVDESTF